nr:MAG TPA: hypothetical protein [Caudoviricetes sp.]
MQQYLITTSEVALLSRTMSMHIDDEKIETYLRESESIDIKSALGDALYLDVRENPEKYEVLLDGGVYELESGKKKLLTGLKTALAYYTYARIVKNGDTNVTRQGFIQPENEYGSRPDFKEKVMAYDDAFSIADRYLKECVLFLNEKSDEFPLYKGKGKIKANRTVYRVIGE